MITLPTLTVVELLRVHTPSIRLTLSGIRREKAEFEWRCECGYLISSPEDWAQHVGTMLETTVMP